MSWPVWDPWGKWALFSVAISAAAMGSNNDQPPGTNGRARTRTLATESLQLAEPTKRPSEETRVEFERLHRQGQQPDNGEEINNAFNTISWYTPPPPPEPAAPPPPPEPTAPPLPFTYLGLYKESDSATQVIILAKADRVYTVSEGDVIDDMYSVGPITAGQLELSYLPLNIKQSLNIGGVL